jgi:hypothetical protein
MNEHLMAEFTREEIKEALDCLSGSEGTYVDLAARAHLKKI